MSLVSTEWLNKNHSKVKIIDATWHMPNTSRKAYEEYKAQHINNAIFFDLDNNSKKNSDLPHMLTDKNSWQKIVSAMGINNNDKIIILSLLEIPKLEIIFSHSFFSGSM